MGWLLEFRDLRGFFKMLWDGVRFFVLLVYGGILGLNVKMYLYMEYIL